MPVLPRDGVSLFFCASGVLGLEELSRKQRICDGDLCEVSRTTLVTGAHKLMPSRFDAWSRYDTDKSGTLDITQVHGSSPL